MIELDDNKAKLLLELIIASNLRPERDIVAAAADIVYDCVSWQRANRYLVKSDKVQQTADQAED